jgi:hypothetical protein
MLKRSDSRGLSKSNRILLIVVFALLFIGIIFFAVKVIKNKPPEENPLDKYTADLQISEVQIINYTDVNVKIEKGTVEGEIDAINFIFYDDNNYEILLRKISMDELEKNNFQAVLHIANTSRISAISIAPVFISESGNKILGKVEDQYNISTGTSSEEESPEEEYPEEESPQENISSCFYDDECDDKNVCTTDSCVYENCVYSDIPDCTSCKSSLQCNDSNVCTKNVCSNGMCLYPLIAGCVSCSSEADCDDTNGCTVERCINNKCAYANVTNCVSCTSNTQCNDNISCTTDSCSGWACLYIAISNCKLCTSVTQCEDNNGCTTESCSNNQCVYTNVNNCKPCTSPSQCEDTNGCTTESCIGNKCVYTNVSNCKSCTSVTQCNDNNACTTDSCSANKCVYSNLTNCRPCTSIIQCEDNNGCTTDSCTGGRCVNTNTTGCRSCIYSSQCNDNNGCTTDSCSGNKCVYSNLTNCKTCTSLSQCNDNNVCTTESCSGGVCSYTPVSGCKSCTLVSECNDDNACTTDSCSGNKCTYVTLSNCKSCTSITECNDNNGCTTDSCTGGRCVNTNTTGCRSCIYSSQCNDNDGCTTESCTGNKCEYVRTTSCAHNDNCCPVGIGCNFLNDNNCRPVCPNGIREGTEQCDTNDFGGATCAGVMDSTYTGTLRCYSTCAFDVSGCSVVCSCPSDGRYCTTDICSNNVCQHIKSTDCCDYSSECSSGQLCTNHVCVTSTPTCTDDCTANDRECYGSGYRTCISNGDSDSCYEWSAVASCSAGYTCNNGICTDSTPKGDFYYISPSGSDSSSRDGSASSPWKTLAYACSRVTTSGSIIHINAGTYTETSACNLAVGVSIEGDSKATSIIRSSVGTSSSTYTILLSSSASNTNGAQHISNIRLESTNAYSAYAAIGVFKRGNVEIYNCDIVNFREHGIVLHNGEQSGVYASGNRIHDCVITNSGMYVGTYNAADGDSRGSIDILSQSDLLIYNNIVTVNRPDGKNGNCIDGVEGYLKNVKIYDNTLHKTFVPGTTWDFAIEFWNVEGGLEIYNNDIIGSIDICKSPNKGTSSYVAWLHDNTLGQNALMASESTRGIDLEYNDNDIIIERNYIKNTAVGINNNLDRAGLVQENIRIDYNILYNIGEAGTDSKGWGIMYSFPDSRFNNVVNNLKIRNNVIIGGGAGSGSTMYGIGLPDVGTATNVEVKNNIIMNFDYYSVYANGRGGTTISGLSMENNIFYGNGQNTAVYAEGMSPQGTTQNNLVTNPKFVSSSDFHLQSGSPAINAGIAISGLTSDRDGKSIIGAPDIGAYEYQGTTCTPSCSGKECGSDGCTGTCSPGCTVAHGTNTCSSSGICQPSCSSGYGNCDGIRTNGCETYLLTSTSNCGSCGNSCLSGQTCTNNVCVISTTGNSYYIATNGNDNNPGTLSQPWATWQKGFDMAQAGDLVYIRGGVYQTAGHSASGAYRGVFVGGKSGTSSNPIRIFAYPGETPILDCSGMTANDYHTGIDFENSNYWYLKGLTLRNVPSALAVSWGAVGIQFYESDNNISEKFSVHNIEGPGFVIGGDNNLFLNCDSYDNYDSKVGGENADGFVMGNNDNRYTNTYRGCRSWHNSDDGFDSYDYEGTAIYENCWAFNNGYGTSGDGGGFKLGATELAALSTPQKVLTNCISADNKGASFDESQDSGSSPHINQIYNCISYNNVLGFNFGYSGTPVDTIRNCISYKDTTVGRFGSNTVNHNSWDISGISVSDSDFVSLDTSQLDNSRKSDGSLPDITFGHLASGSDLINAGTSISGRTSDGEGNPIVGLPDIGAFERQ